MYCTPNEEGVNDGRRSMEDGKNEKKIRTFLAFSRFGDVIAMMSAMSLA
jgi:hypothetical protein